MAEIIDASVAVKWFLDEPGHDLAMTVLHRALTHPQRFCVPELFYFELAHVLNRVVGDLSEQQQRLFEHVVNLGVHRFAMSADLHKKICGFQKMGLSGYDSAYVAVAASVSGVWLTFDQKAHQRVRHLGLSKCLATL